MCKHGMQSEWCTHCDPRGGAHVNRCVRSHALEYQWLGDGRLALDGNLIAGWRVGQRTGCYIGQCGLEWGEVKGTIKVSLFPWPSDRSLSVPPELRAAYDSGTGIAWQVQDDRVRGQIELLQNGQANPGLAPKRKGLNMAQLYHDEYFGGQPMRVRVQLVISLDLEGAKPRLIWRENLGTISAGLPGSGKRR